MRKCEGFRVCPWNYKSDDRRDRRDEFRKMPHDESSAVPLFLRCWRTAIFTAEKVHPCKAFNRGADYLENHRGIPEKGRTLLPGRDRADYRLSRGLRGADRKETDRKDAPRIRKGVPRTKGSSALKRHRSEY